VLDRKKLDALGCHDNRSGDLIVSPLPGYTMSNAGASGGQHCRFAEQNPLLLFRGPGFKPGATVDAAETIDVVPTLLRLVNVPPATSMDGKVIANALQDQHAQVRVGSAEKRKTPEGRVTRVPEF
jgi:arylsulfatase A-like enzyme